MGLDEHTYDRRKFKSRTQATESFSSQAAFSNEWQIQ